MNINQIAVFTTPEEGNTQEAFQGAHAQTFAGVVNADGSWAREPAAGWTCEHVATGQYHITHYQSNINYGVSVAADPTSGCHISIVPASQLDESFTVWVMDDAQVSQDCAFSFTICFY